MIMRVRTLVFLLLAGFLWIFSLKGEEANLQQLIADAGIISLNEKAIDFTLPDLKGNNISLSDYKGKVILLNFWTTWCPNCRKERPYLEELYQKFKDKDFILLAVNIKESREDVESFVNRYNLSFTHLLDKEDEVSRKYNAFAVPTSFIINKQGFIVGKAIGLRQWGNKQITNIFEYLFKEEARP